MSRETPAPDYKIEVGDPILGKGDHPLRDLLAELVDDLEPEDRYVIEAWAYERVTYAELARRLGLAGRQGGHYRVLVALEKLAEALAERGIDSADALHKFIQYEEGDDDA